MSVLLFVGICGQPRVMQRAWYYSLMHRRFWGLLAKAGPPRFSLKREIMRIAALQLAGDILLKLVYVPSEDNPADAPSRGVVRRWRRRPVCVPRSKKQLAAAGAQRRADYLGRAALRRSQRFLRQVNSKIATLKKHNPELASFFSPSASDCEPN